MQPVNFDEVQWQLSIAANNVAYVYVQVSAAGFANFPSWVQGQVYF